MPVIQAKLLGGSCSEGSGSGFAGFFEKKYPGSQGRTASPSCTARLTCEIRDGGAIPMKTYYSRKTCPANCTPVPDFASRTADRVGLVTEP